MADGRCCTFLEILFAIILPPLGVFLRFGCCRSSASACCSQSLATSPESSTRSMSLLLSTLTSTRGNTTPLLRASGCARRACTVESKSVFFFSCGLSDMA
uniref:Uncharacterized protein n=1 Tax=Zea mays TaxID=4577 RepID=A0A804MQN2_MAIZE